MNYEQWRQWWIDIAPTYFVEKVWNFSKPDLINRLGIEKHHCVLELGFGYGREISQFCKLSDHVYGLELTEWACKHVLKELEVRGVAPLPHLAAYDGRIIPFPTGAFHAIYSCFVIQHLSRAHAREIIREALRTLKHDGQVLFEFFGDPLFCRDGEDVFSGTPGEGGMFNNAFTAEELPGFIEVAGGKVKWIENKPVTEKWGNYWVCFGKNE